MGSTSLPPAPAPFAADTDFVSRESVSAAFARAFGRPPAVVATAPGRIELIGNHTDYNGGPVLGAAINRGTTVALARRDDGRIRLLSDLAHDCVDLVAGPVAKQSGVSAWANYPLGVWRSLEAAGMPALAGFDYLALSTLPIGAGLSSSAALELATACALLALQQHTLSRDAMVRICRQAENDFVGVPCGLLDQTVSAFGRENHVVHLDARGPAISLVPLPAHARFWVFNTDTKHALIDGLYATRHAECVGAARALGVSRLVDADPAVLEQSKSRLTIEEARRARHVVDEIIRVRETRAMLDAGNLAAVGRLMQESHFSSRVHFENSTPQLDFLVDALVRTPQVYGARLTGGGFGGAVLALTGEHFDAASAASVAECYATRFGAPPAILALRSAEGARVL